MRAKRKAYALWSGTHERVVLYAEQRQIPDLTTAINIALNAYFDGQATAKLETRSVSNPLPPTRANASAELSKSSPQKEQNKVDLAEVYAGDADYVPPPPPWVELGITQDAYAIRLKESEARMAKHKEKLEAEQEESKKERMAAMLAALD